MKAQEGKTEEGEEEESRGPIAPSLPTSKSQCPRFLGVNAAGYPPEEDPFDPGPIDPEKGPDLYPPDPHDVWANIKKQALREGELEVTKTIVAPVLYTQGRAGRARWEALSFSVVKELRRTVTEHGLSSPYFTSVVDSDSVDKTKIMAWTPFPPCTTPQGSQIAQLILIPARRPMYQCTLIYHDQQIALNGIIDTGADVTVISQAKWPPQWPLTDVSQMLAGIGGTVFHSEISITVFGDPDGTSLKETGGVGDLIGSSRHRGFLGDTHRSPIHKALRDVPWILESRKLFAFEWENPQTGRRMQLTWTRLPQGFKNSPTIFGNQLAKELEIWKQDKSRPGHLLLQYVDDILIATEERFTCIQVTIDLLNFLGLNGYKVSRKKAQIACQTVIYLGFEISKGQRQLGKDRKEAICGIPEPRNIHELRAFLGMTGWCRLWIMNYGLIAKPLYEAQKNSPLAWGPQQQKAFCRVKTCLNVRTCFGTSGFNQRFSVVCSCKATPCTGSVNSEDRKLERTSRILLQTTGHSE
ncbi:uncharacterized protein LOC129734622 [Falco cherrug]|uniref:uncharacterized protein LOC129734622 n=1 Tax=Falco cherrug TaxID=345164 RepID=UPI002478CE05|nr:uncharacterized protein LOC129734622 [Falco cherrug]